MSAGGGDTVRLLQRLVAFDTTSHRSNLELIEFARARLEAAGARCRVLPTPDGRKANLFATIGPDTAGGLMLSGHSDVVPADPDQWTSDPFMLTHREGRYYGRGSADMKGFIAAVLAAAPAFAEADLPVPVHVALTYDEEVGCLGAPPLVETMSAMVARPALCIVGEPTGMQVGVGHKGARAYQATFLGTTGHSGYAPRAVNAVEHAATLVVKLKALGERFAAHGPFDPGYDIPHTTVHTGIVRGGSQVNIVPARCDVEFEFRPLPTADGDAIEAEIRGWVDGEIVPAMRRGGDGCGVDLTNRYAYPGLSMDPAHPAVAAVRALADPAAEAVNLAFGTEAGWFRQGLGMPCLVCGPGHITDAHRPDEFVSEAQLAACERLLQRLRTALASAESRRGLLAGQG